MTSVAACNHHRWTDVIAAPLHFTVPSNLLLRTGRRGGGAAKLLLFQLPVTHLCRNSMIFSLFRRCGSVYFSCPFSKYLMVGKPEILKRSPTALCTVESTAANTPGLCGEERQRGASVRRHCQ